MKKAVKSFKKFISVLDEQDKKSALEFIFYVFVFGSLFNFCLLVIFKIPFTFYSWIGWGIAIWFFENKLVKGVRSIIRK